MHILSPETDNCPSWISGRERMTVENNLWSISTKECYRPRRGLNPRPPGPQSYLRTCARGEDSDQPAYSRSLIRFFTERILDNGDSNQRRLFGQRRLLSDYADAQADLNLRWAHRLAGTFSVITDHIIVLTSHSKRTSTIPDEAPAPASPMKCSLPILLPNMDAPT